MKPMYIPPPGLKKRRGDRWALKVLFFSLLVWLGLYLLLRS